MRLNHAVEGSVTTVIAALLGTSEMPTEDSAALLRRATAFSAVVARSGPWDPLRDIALIARRDALAAETPAELRHAALGFIASLTRENVIQDLVEAACGLGSLTPELEALLAAGGDRAVWGIARALERREGKTDVEFRSFLLRLGLPAWEKALESAGDRSFEEVAALLPVIARMPQVSARTLGYALLKHDDSRVCRRALAFLLNLGQQDDAWRRLVLWALKSADQGQADIARSAVLRLSPPDASLLESALGESTPTVATGRLRQDLEHLISTLPTESSP